MSSEKAAVVDVLVATGNPGKLREIRALTARLPIRWRTLDEFPQVPPAIEDGDTFAENARRKARHYSLATGLWALADDSGLEVDALGGAPGVHSAHYAGVPRDDQANNRKLVAALAGVTAAARTARFRCALALADGARILLEADACVAGCILDEPRGAHGFGYDPLFLLPELGCTFAELPDAEKNARSHRGAALRAFLPSLEALLRARGLWPD